MCTVRGAAQSDPDEADVNDEAVDSMDEDEEDDGAVSTETENPAVDTIEADTRQEKENRDEDATRLVGIPLKIIAGNANPELAEAVGKRFIQRGGGCSTGYPSAVFLTCCHCFSLLIVHPTPLCSI